MDDLDATLRSLNELAMNLRWSWNRSADELWGRMDRELWELTQNPLVILQTVSQEKLREVAADPKFCERLDEIVKGMRESMDHPAWFQNAHPDAPLKLAAYFSMEYMLTEALPIYSGGLGNVAGDQLKAVSDLGVPVVGVGLLYQQGYFRQEIDAYGNQQALYPFNDPGQLPVKPVRDTSGEWVRLALALPGLKLWVRAWQVQVGRTLLYLLDSNDPANTPAYRGITSELYGGGLDVRIKQEMVLGIGGWRLLRTLGLKPDVCHLNEGHAAFAVLERARSYMTECKQPFDAALAVTRAGNLFTTHTPVGAGFDRFPPDLMERYLRHYADHTLGIGMHDMLALGRLDPNDNSEPFNMAYLALRGSGAVNAVSRLHGQVSRRLFSVLFPRWPESEVPIGYVTNGVHVPTWESQPASDVWKRACGDERWLGTMECVGPNLRGVSDADLWELRTKARRQLIERTRRRLARQRSGQGAGTQEVAAAERIFDFDTLTLAFARRFAAYKRPNLLLADPERLARILTDKQRPVQLLLAGKAHPADLEGQGMLKQWSDFLHRPDVRPHVVFLADYDMLLTERLVHGADVWINTPRRPWEASGTSGMKVLVNGGVNLSELDGWWAEAYQPDIGWAIGDGQEHHDDPAWDHVEAEELYSRLESEVIPEFYNRNEAGIPTAWIARMRESMARLTPQFSANRTVRQYVEEHYLPAATAYRERSATCADFASGLLGWQRALATHWPHVHFGGATSATADGAHTFEVQVYLDELDPEAVHVELYADPDVRQVMTRGQQLVGSANGYMYTGRVPADRPASDYTPRLVPYRAGVRVPLEAPQILWQR
ncbi:MAG TPA: alpha-glucan family phosphorylase [Bryobacteraceae bacterium]|nr:alpha-glucan family phosphorylase [Bryobacteraceae bacterium]